MKLIGIVGTNSAESTNRKLLQYMQSHLADKAEIELVEVKDIPVFNKPADKKVPEKVTEIATKIETAEGMIIATPEYDHSIPAASYGKLGSSRAQAQLRQILDAPELKASVMPGSEFLLAHSLQAFDEAGNLIDLETVQKLDALFDDFRIFVKITAKLSNAHELLHQEAENFDWENL
ncbi:NADPH-dependent FMN reductase [Ligilactobacillus murinus]|uniref:NADPH-dependent FMN reductase n=1 Tax=Ligilactobacillus murinus TaxID=1622 RepID=UPI002DD673AD|nr:NADPH-dependent FMN reductase [Ligilactobacillus murinus]WRY37151.1 NAD(P)H-dependent oxidoreductase [Ligilactobacillus murinus]